MLDGYGLHEITWNMADQVISGDFVASPCDAHGRGIALAVRQNGAAADLTDASVYLVWRHRMTGKRGTEEFEAIDASAGTFEVYYPASMQECGGVVDAQVMVSTGEDSCISTRTFQIRVEPVTVGELETPDGFTLFVGAIHAYENATDISTEAAISANEAATAANTAAGNASQAAADLRAAAENGDFDGADGQDGADGFSPTATVIQTAGGATITITDKNGTTTADVAKGAKGDTGEQGPKGIKIADFGLGKNLNTLASHITSSTRNYGQYFYCSPEQLLYLKDGDKRSDVFSLGRLINFVMTGDPVNEAHKLRHVSEKATSQDPSNRYQDASELLEAFRRRLAISDDEQRVAAIVDKMQGRIIDDEVSGWILEMQPRQLCEKIISLPGFANAIARFACDSGQHATFVVDSIGDGMVEACGRSFEANDPFASISSQVAMSDTAPFDVRERACVILAYVAHCVNRFNAQRIVDDLRVFCTIGR